MEVHIGQIITGIISGIKPYGVFIKFEDNFGFCHISNVSKKFIKNINEILSIGQEVKAKIIEIDNDDNRINVSIKDCQEVVVPIKQTIVKSTKIERIEEHSFEDMLKDFLKTSDEKIDSIGKRYKKHQKR